MALLGPVGSGKTALVYAAAQELGFGVLEVNPSMERTAGQVCSGKLQSLPCVATALFCLLTVGCIADVSTLHC